MVLLRNNASEKYTSGFVYTVEGQEVVFRLKVANESLPPQQRKRPSTPAPGKYTLLDL
jgi:hypothetical protein